MIKCFYGTKVGDSIIRDEYGVLQSIYPNLFYPTGMKAYWMLKQIGYFWVVIRVLVKNKS